MSADVTRLVYQRESRIPFLAQMTERGGKQVVFLGCGEIAEIAYLTLHELGLQLVGVFDDNAAGDA